MTHGRLNLLNGQCLSDRRRDIVKRRIVSTKPTSGPVVFTSSKSGQSVPTWRWRKLIAKSFVVPQRPSRVKERWWWWWWWWWWTWHGEARLLLHFFLNKCFLRWNRMFTIPQYLHWNIQTTRRTNAQATHINQCKIAKSCYSCLVNTHQSYKAYCAWAFQCV